MYRFGVSMQFIACILLFQFLISCRALAPVENIRDANANEFPFLASIGYKNYHVNHICSGSLINKKFILTADHCFKDKKGNVVEKPEELQVKVNAVSLKQTPTHYNVKGWILYDEWAAKNKKKLNHNDIAIVLLTEEVKGVQSGQLSDAKRSSLTNKPVTLIGYGGTDETGSSDKLQVASVKVLAQNECIEKYRELTKTRAVPTNDHFCTQGSPNPAVLQNSDSGGPVLDSSKEIVGVSIYSCSGSISETVNMHLTIEDHRDFIEDVTKNPQKYF